VVPPMATGLSIAVGVSFRCRLRCEDAFYLGDTARAAYL